MSESELSFRDQCAISAMSAMLSNGDSYYQTREERAEYAFDMADAMVAERKERARTAGEEVDKIMLKRKKKVD